jgi:signal transduction histidine kinase/ActR/RegA family two-component response regulator
LARPAETAKHWREHVDSGEEPGWSEFELVRPSRKIVERFARPLLDSEGVRIGWLEVFRDITGQRLIQSTLLQMEKMAALGELVSGIAHELNNPLTSIQGYAQLLLSRRTIQDRAGDALRILQEAERAARIVKNLLLFSRETKPERRAVQLNEVIERTVALRAYELKVQNIELELALDPVLPQTLADAAQLQQVVLNLIVNAEQAIVADRAEEPRNGRILIRTRRLARDRLGMEVSDDGPGIAPEIAARIFDPFFTTKFTGRGLGLAAVLGIIRSHKGSIAVDSTPGVGSTFTVVLPATRSTAENSARELNPDLRGNGNVLVVDDEDLVRNMARVALERCGYTVEVADDGAVAVESVAARPSYFDAVLLDLTMPVMGGDQALKEIHAIRADIPVILSSGFSEGEALRRFADRGLSGFLQKPYSASLLARKMKQAIEQRRRQ